MEKCTPQALGYKINVERGSSRLLGAADSLKMQGPKLQKPANDRSLASKFTETKKEHSPDLSRSLK